MLDSKYFQEIKNRKTEFKNVRNEKEMQGKQDGKI